MSRRFLFVLLVAAVIALVLRLPALGLRPMHTDEAVNAIKFGQLWEHGAYKYDPNEHHGPSLFYATLALGRLTGAPDFKHYSERRLRLVTVLFGFGLVLLVPLLGDGLGTRGAGWAALFLAVSPAMVFYSRYFIHEMLLVFFTLLALAAGWRYWRSRKLGWILLAGGALGLMDATKETFVLTLGAAAVAVLVNQTWNRVLDASGPPVRAPRLNRAHLAAGLLVWFIVALLLFSSFFTNANGPLDSLRTYRAWASRAEGASPHLHPWSFYLHRLLWFHPAAGPVFSEVFILILATIAAWVGFARKGLGNANPSFVRFLALYTFLLAAFYSLLAYKTPWCLLNFWFGAVLLAGVGASVLLNGIRDLFPRIAMALVLVAGAFHLAWQAWQLDTTYAADRRNPYIYAQTSPNLRELVARVESIIAASPQGTETLIKVMVADGDYWPLPWYLREYRQTGWWDHLIGDPFAPIMIVSAQWHANLDTKQSHLMVGYFELRPEVFLELYVEKELWTTWLARHPSAP
jgi:uncharacterized protein (TIGR03663 family)